jgi:cysteine desulfurase/selenocysteine lyase
LESGTLNAIGIAGLGAAVNRLLSEGLPSIRARKKALVRQFMEGAADIPGVVLYGASDPVDNAGVISLNLNGIVCSELGLILDRAYGILTRTGLHCAPAAHKTIGSFPQGTVRFSVGAYTSAEDITATLRALKIIAAAAAENA